MPFSKTAQWALRVFLFTLPLLLLDQLTKLALYSADINQSLVGDFIRLKLEKNTGIAFSIPLPQWFLLAIIPIFILALAIFLAKQLSLQRWPVALLYALFLAGAIGNWLDRLNYGFVIDFIQIGQFPVFNLADSFLTISIFLIIVFYDKIKRFK